MITDTAQRPPMFASTSSNQEEFVFEQERSRGGLVISDDDDESPATPPLKIEVRTFSLIVSSYVKPKPSKYLGSHNRERPPFRDIHNRAEENNPELFHG